MASEKISKPAELQARSQVVNAGGTTLTTAYSINVPYGYAILAYFKINYNDDAPVATNLNVAGVNYAGETDHWTGVWVNDSPEKVTRTANFQGRWSGSGSNQCRISYVLLPCTLIES